MRRFLLVDDDPTTRALWENSIRHLVDDVEVTSMASADALFVDGTVSPDVAKNYDVIVSDIFLAGDVTGVELMNALSPEVQRKSILCSGIDVPRFLEVRRQLGLKCVFVQKPLSPTLMRCALQRVLDEQIPSSECLATPIVEIKDDRPVLLVTGCSSGPGLKVAEALAEVHAYRVVLTAKASSLPFMRFHFVECDRLVIETMDLRDPDQIRSAVANVIDRWGRIDVVINNAGVCFRSVVEHMDVESELEQMQTNYLGPMALIRQVLPSMRERGRGKIINVSTLAGSLGMPTMASYSASKHAFEAASESLWHEMRPLGINVTVVRPSFFDCPSLHRIVSPEKASLAGKLRGPYADYYEFMNSFIAWCLRRRRPTSPSVANRIMDVIRTQNPPLWINATADAKLFHLMKRVIPANWFHRALIWTMRIVAPLGRDYSRATRRRLRA
ncbi:MAG: SDR family NAD(P)-dependent oxidoreductase [Bdellovibrionota bacterium]